jgi:hypothetical protein
VQRLSTASAAVQGALSATAAGTTVRTRYLASVLA